MTSASAVSDLQYIKFVGPKRAAALRDNGILSPRDLLYTFPRKYLDRSRIVKIGDLSSFDGAPEPVTIIADVVRSEVRRTARFRKPMFIMVVRDETGVLTSLWFEGVQYLRERFEVGELIALSAIPSKDKFGRYQFIHPEIDRLSGPEEDEPDWGKLYNTGAIIPQYRSNKSLVSVGLDSRGFRRIIRSALQSIGAHIEETLSRPLIEKRGIIPLQSALQNIHFPRDEGWLKNARLRLKYEELFYLQLLMALRRRFLKHETAGVRLFAKSPSARKLIDALPFKLTQAQKNVLREIATDLESGFVMNRLLQGDVGSGKTIVSILTMLVAVDNNLQSALMAPTEILAEQHYAALCKWLKDTSVTVVLVTGSQRSVARKKALEALRNGTAHIAVGTHALIQDAVEFKNLALAIIDEQHRFGVAQRAALRSKGKTPHILVMTATPIPRTLAMTVYGDLDVSVINEMPAQRKPIKTYVRQESEKKDVYEFVRAQLRIGRQAYFVFPIIESSEKLDLKAATEEFERLRSEVYSEWTVGLLHGRIKGDEKNRIMEDFKANRIQVLVATTVVEVGIDVPNATVMVVENAYRYGLAQLHQLRGRVGRGGEQSYCILLTGDLSMGRVGTGDIFSPFTGKEEVQKRLAVMASTTDGFIIAEADLRLRGPGEMFGTRQSGLPQLVIADLSEDTELLQLSRDDARSVVESDPHLRRPEHSMMRKEFQTRFVDPFNLSLVG